MLKMQFSPASAAPLLLRPCPGPPAPSSRPLGVGLRCAAQPPGPAERAQPGLLRGDPAGHGAPIGPTRMEPSPPGPALTRTDYNLDEVAVGSLATLIDAARAEAVGVCELRRAAGSSIL
ncbi:hypothetical protein BRADI_2g52586v3 [Brachypodium distachyon]|uniref:Uncharacterized protein n=1 Tax=Brachypodium distachyon TaxID=15368 RepID=A0A2K2DFH4_BRADI|nr:hypothetical protein BRADI_2g52586v3 [Brachypodium distachyon]